VLLASLLSHESSFEIFAVDFWACWTNCGLTLRWSQRRLPLEFMDGLSYTKITEIAEPLARRRGSALDR
jgi:hypothetical protein